MGDLGKQTSFDDSEGRPRFNDPVDLYGWLSSLTVGIVQFTDCRLAYCMSLGDLCDIEGAEGLMIRSIRTDG